MENLVWWAVRLIKLQFKYDNDTITYPDRLLLPTLLWLLFSDISLSKANKGECFCYCCCLVTSCKSQIISLHIVLLCCGRQMSLTTECSGFWNTTAWDGHGMARSIWYHIFHYDLHINKNVSEPLPPVGSLVVTLIRGGVNVTVCLCTLKYDGGVTTFTQSMVDLSYVCDEIT